MGAQHLQGPGLLMHLIDPVIWLTGRENARKITLEAWGRQPMILRDIRPQLRVVQPTQDCAQVPRHAHHAVGMQGSMTGACATSAVFRFDKVCSVLYAR